MKTIVVSDEVYEYLNSKSNFTLNTPDAVLRSLLPINILSNDKVVNKGKVLLKWKGVEFPEGMQLRFKGRNNELALVKDGNIVYQGNQYSSPSAAAVAANNGTSTNGWIHWEYLDLKTGTWKLIDTLRNDQ